MKIQKKYGDDNIETDHDKRYIRIIPGRYSEAIKDASRIFDIYLQQAGYDKELEPECGWREATPELIHNARQYKRAAINYLDDIRAIYKTKFFSTHRK